MLCKQILELQRGVNAKWLGSEEQDQLRKLLSISEIAWNRIIQHWIRKCLIFKDMLERWEQVEQAHIDTCQWLLDTRHTLDMKSANLIAQTRYIQWLASGLGTFHVASKPGSGKSTLMKFIVCDPRTRSTLQQWTGESNITRVTDAPTHAP
jgi:hypothetical protein